MKISVGLQLVLRLSWMMAIAALVSRAAFADVNIISLGAAVGDVTFTGDGTSVGMTLGNCAGGTCSLSGPLAFGYGDLASFGSWTISTSASNQIALTEDSSGQWSVSDTSPVYFSYGIGGALLNGTINLVNMFQWGGNYFSTSGGTMTTDPKTGGSLAQNYGQTGAISWTVDLGGSIDLGTLLGSAGFGHIVQGQAIMGELNPTPDPPTLILIGSGLVLGGGFMRRRLFKRGSNG